MKLNTEHPAYVLVYAAVTAGLFTGAIMSLQAASAPVVRRNRELFEQKALVELFETALGLADVAALPDERIMAVYRKHIRRRKAITDERSGEAFQVMEAVTTGPDGSERLLGYAFNVHGIGFWARIDGWLAVTPDLEKLLGVVFVAHRETPGLGGRITEKKWRDAFRGLKASEPPGGGKILHIGAAGPAERRVDAITGATGTSKAVERFLNDDIRRFRRAAAAAGLIRGQ